MNLSLIFSEMDESTYNSELASFEFGCAQFFEDRADCWF
jgi:hypothetical protein